MEQFDIYWAIVDFEDKPENKERPILIVNGKCHPIVARKITSKKKDKNLQLEISAWKEAGLDRPSYIEMTKVIDIDKKDVLYKKGQLQLKDIYNYQLWNLNK